MFEVDAYNRDKEGTSTLKKPGESSVQSIAEEEEDTDGLAASVDHDTTESRKSTADSSLNQDNVHSGSSSFDVGTLTGFPTIKELEKVVRTGHLPHPPEFSQRLRRPQISNNRPKCEAVKWRGSKKKLACFQSYKDSTLLFAIQVVWPHY